MNITFLIGNGFDLNLGLNTRYIDFYKYYMENNPDDLISRSIANNFDRWSDLEVSLGGFLGSIDENQIEEFLNSKCTLEKILSEYLILENQRFHIKDEKAISREFNEKVLNFSADFNAVDREHYHKVIQNTNESISYQFITFNYTNILDTIISKTQKHCDPFGHHVCNGIGHNDWVTLPHHIHGKLNQDLILGLDNAEQILNDALKSNPKLINYIIKPNVNTALGERKIEKAKEIIDNSRFVCLFGLSIGDTDRIWWKYLIEWLDRSKDNRLIIFANKKTIVSQSGQEKIRFRDLTREYILKKSGFEIHEAKQQIQEKIIVVQNSSIFTFDNSFVEEK